MTQIQGIHHAQITVPKGAEAAARSFYCGVLGLQELAKPTVLQGRGGFWLRVPAAGSGSMEVHVGVEDGFERTTTKAHLAYEVADLEAMQATLRQSKLELKVAPDLPEIPGLKRFECRDPFGNRMEFVERIKASAEIIQDPKARFSDRVADYVKYRPSYPPEVISFFQQHLGLSRSSVTADIGSGTGVFSELLLKAGGIVYGVEPNGPMRAAAESLLGGQPHFRSIAASAEATGLPQQSIDIVTAAQAAHWFNAEKAKSEFRRILKPGGFLALIWNVRREDETAFAKDYEELISEFGTDYHAVAHRNVNQAKLFAPRGYAMERFDYYQEFDFEGLKGRLLSSSYIPPPGHPKCAEMLAALRLLFDRHQVNGQVRIDYDTQLYWGKFG